MANIYQNLRNNEFLPFKNRLKVIEKNIEEVCNENGFTINKDRFYNSTLAINLVKIKSDDQFSGNICLSFQDEKGDKVFSLDVVKTYGHLNFRYFKKLNVQKFEPLDFYEQNIVSLIGRAFSIYYSIDKSDLTSKIEMPDID